MSDEPKTFKFNLPRNPAMEVAFKLAMTKRKKREVEELKRDEPIGASNHTNGLERHTEPTSL